MWRQGRQCTAERAQPTSTTARAGTGDAARGTSDGVHQRAGICSARDSNPPTAPRGGVGGVSACRGPTPTRPKGTLSRPWTGRAAAPAHLDLGKEADRRLEVGLPAASPPGRRLLLGLERDHGLGHHCACCLGLAFLPVPSPRKRSQQLRGKRGGPSTSAGADGARRSRNRLSPRPGGNPGLGRWHERTALCESRWLRATTRQWRSVSQLEGKESTARQD